MHKKESRRDFIKRLGAGAAALSINSATLPLARPTRERKNSADLSAARRQGAWEVIGNSGVVGIHAALLHTGKILFFERPEHPFNQNTSVNYPPPGGSDLSTVYELSGPEAGSYAPAYVQRNPFCLGQTFLPDGRILAAGGDKAEVSHPFTTFGLNALRTFTPAADCSGQWEDIGNISGNRWYPTCTSLPDGRVFIISGTTDDQAPDNNLNPTFEVIPPLPGGPRYLPWLDAAWPYATYPHVFVLPSGALFVFANRSTYFINTETWAVETRGVPPLGSLGRSYPNTSAAVLLPLSPDDGYSAEVMIFGGGGENIYPQFQPSRPLANDTCARMKVDEASPRWEVMAMPHHRVMPDAVLLPDGTVLVVNGAANGFAGGDAGAGVATNPVYAADLYDPKTRRWTTLASATVARLYHSTALLLPDGRVLTAGCDQALSQVPYEYRVEAFSPPYLFSGAPRPVIEDAPARLTYGLPFHAKVSNPASVERAALVGSGAVTHSNNMHQRHVELRITGRSATHLTLEAPPSANVAPPGYYMLFLLSEGVPSVAKFVRLTDTPIPVPEGEAVGVKSFAAATKSEGRGGLNRAARPEAATTAAPVYVKAADSAQPRPHAIPAAHEGLEGWWALKDGAGVRANDSSGNRNHGQLRGGVSWTTELSGPVLNFDGSTGYVEASARGLPAGSSPRTLAARFKLNGLPQDKESTLLLWGDPLRNQACGLQVRHDAGKSLIRFHGWGHAVDAAVKLSPDAWYHVAATHDGRLTIIYLDGKPLTSVPAPGLNTATVNAPCFLGQGVPGGGRLGGSLSDVRVYGRVLTPLEVRSLASPVAYSGLLLWLRGDEGVLADSVGGLSSWSDRSGNECDAVAPSYNQQHPTWVQDALNGHPVLRFNGSSNYLQTTKALPGGAAPYFIFLVVANIMSVGIRGLIGWGNYGSANEVNAFRLGPGADGGAQLMNYWWGNDLATPPNVSLGAMLLEASFDGKSRYIRRNGVVIAKDTPTRKNTAPTKATIGSTFKTEYLQGDIAEVLIYQTPPSSADRDSIETYLRSKYKLW